MKIAIFYHCLLIGGNPPNILPAALDIVLEQMEALHESGLLDAAMELHIGLNGGAESEALAMMFFPEKAQVTFHGLESRNENLTILQIERWVPMHKDWAVLYFHCKGGSRPPGDIKSANWRRCMSRLIWSWKQCVEDLEICDSVGVHWLTPPRTPPGQYIWAGNFWWAKAAFLATLPRMVTRQRIRMSGIGSPESRYEAETWIGNGPRIPVVMDYHRVPIETCTG